jgi:SAM-dependent methyltransferase
MVPEIPDYNFHDAAPLWSSHYLWPVVRSILRSQPVSSRRAFDLGCGNGSIANMLTELGFEVTGVDPSESGIAIAKKAYPHCIFAHGDGYEDLADRFGQFGLVVCFEVLHHCTYPEKVTRRLFDLVEPGGIAMLSMTYHGYWKNLALALTGQMDKHHDALEETGPLKFFSVNTLAVLLRQTGFRHVDFHRVGRVPIFARTMIAVARKVPDKSNGVREPFGG